MRLYSELIFIDRKALKLAHSWLGNGFSNVASGKTQPLEIRSRDCAKYRWGCNAFRPTILN